MRFALPADISEYSFIQPDDTRTLIALQEYLNTLASMSVGLHPQLAFTVGFPSSFPVAPPVVMLVQPVLQAFTGVGDGTAFEVERLFNISGFLI